MFHTILKSTTLFLFALILSFPILSIAQNITNGLIAYYPFVNGSKDEAGKSPDAVVQSMGYTKDMHGFTEGAPILVGNGDYIEFADSVNLGTPGWTYSMWFRLGGMPADIYEADAFLLTYSNTNFGDDVHLFIDDEDNMIKTFFANGFYKISTGVRVNRNQWYHAALRYTNTTTDLFVNGEFKVSAAGRFTPRPYYSPIMVSSLYGGSTTKGRLFGNADNLRMYKRLLSNEDIKSVYDTERNWIAPPSKDTVVVHDTIVRTDTIIRYNTVIQHDTIIKQDTIVLLDTIIMTGDCVIYPNPAKSGKVYIQTNNSATTVLIYNAAGQLVRREDVRGVNYFMVDTLANGLYFLKIITSAGTCGNKLIVQH